MSSALLITLLTGTIVRSVPLILASMGGLISGRSGVINIALEGKMMVAIAVGAYAGAVSGSEMTGIAFALLSSVALALLHWLTTQVYSVDHIISGVAVNMIGFGAASFFLDPLIFPTNVTRVPTLPVDVFIFVALTLPPALALYMDGIKGGLQRNAVSSETEESLQMGIVPAKVHFWSMCATGVLCGLAGAMIVANEAGQVSEGMTAGRGFIALAALIIGGWRPVQGMLACLFFAFFEALRINSPLLEQYFPQPVLISLPYLVTVVALAGWFGRSRQPAGLGRL
jgi:ABC-type uncharacterized transport system permease subunit